MNINIFLYDYMQYIFQAYYSMWFALKYNTEEYISYTSQINSTIYFLIIFKHAQRIILYINK